MVRIGKKLRQAAAAQGVSDAEVARRIGISPERYGNYVRDKRQADYDTLLGICRVLSISPDYLFGLDDDAPPLPSSFALSAPAPIPEIDVRAGLGGGGEALSVRAETGMQDAARALWSLPEDYLRSELRVSAPALRIVETQGDSMEPTLFSGDRAMIDTAQRRPSPPGIFALWDGFGVVVKRIEHIPNSDPPRLLIASDNKRHGVYERLIDEVRIIGRVVWFARKL